MTDLYHAFMGKMATVFDDLQEAYQALAQLPPAQERTVLLKCVRVLQEGVNNTCVYFQTVVPAPISLTDEPPIADDDTHPDIAITFDED